MNNRTEAPAVAGASPNRPVSELASAFAEIDDAARRSTIERVVTSYRHPWDIYAELLQNSVDAIYDQAEAGRSGEFLGQIIITIDTAGRRVRVQDNGLGIPAAEVGKLIATSKSLKRDRQRYGFMGFGLTFVAFQTSYLRLETVHDGMRSVRTYHNLFKYVFGDVGELPEADEAGSPPEPVKEANGTTITAEFPPEFPREHKEYDLAQAFTVAKNAPLFSVALRSKTAIGNVDKLFGHQPAAEISIMVEVDSTSFEVPFRYFDFAEMLSELKCEEGQWKSLNDFEALVKLTEGDTPEQQQKKRSETAIFNKSVDLSVGERTPLKFDMYVFVTSKTHFAAFNKMIGAPTVDDAETESPWGLSTGVHLALGGLPTSIKLDDWTHPSLAPFTVLINAHGIVSRELDAGRKGISVHRRDQLMRFVMEQLSSLKLRSYAKYVVGSQPPPNPFEDERKEYVKSFERLHKRRSPYSSVYVPPAEEQEVIAIFFDLVGRGTLRGYQARMLSAYRTYDALVEYELRPSPESLYDRNRNPLGILQQTFDLRDGVLARDDALVEFKTSLTDLYEDIRKVGHAKDTRDIDLLVCWDLDPQVGMKFGDVVSEIRPNERHFFGSTHKIISPMRKILLEVISLQSVLESAAAIAGYRG